MKEDLQAFLRHTFVSNDFLYANNLTRGAIIHNATSQVVKIIQMDMAESNRKRDCFWFILCLSVAVLTFLCCYLYR